MQRVVTRQTTIRRSVIGARSGPSGVSAIGILPRVALASKGARKRHQLVPVGHALDVDPKLVARAQNRGVSLGKVLVRWARIIPVSRQIQHESAAAARLFERA